MPTLSWGRRDPVLSTSRPCPGDAPVFLLRRRRGASLRGLAADESRTSLPRGRAPSGQSARQTPHLSPNPFPGLGLGIRSTRLNPGSQHGRVESNGPTRSPDSGEGAARDSTLDCERCNPEPLGNLGDREQLRQFGDGRAVEGCIIQLRQAHLDRSTRCPSAVGCGRFGLGTVKLRRCSALGKIRSKDLRECQ
jgi:hypothetical protein